MKTLNLIQGSQEWLDARAKYFTASEASVMMGASPYKTRSQLIHEKKTGEQPEINAATQAIFDRGHNSEANARAIAEGIVGEDLYPATAIDDYGYLLASFDGITMLDDVIWEHKLWNEAKAESVRVGNIPECDLWQVVQQLVVSGADKCLYMVSDGTKDKMVYCWVTLQDGQEEALAAGWNQFAVDLASYTPKPPKAEPAAEHIDSLPALLIDIEGEVKSTNIATFKDAAIAKIKGINKELKTDKDFASAETMVKFLSAGEKDLDAAKQHALSKTATIDELFKTIDDVKAVMRETRLELTKLVAAKKKAVKYTIAKASNDALTDYIGTLNAKLGGAYITAQADFNTAMKAKKTVATLQSSADDELAKSKIAAAQCFERVEANLAIINKACIQGYSALFNDSITLALKPTEDLESIIIARIASHAESQRKAEAVAEEKQKTEAVVPTDPAPRSAPDQRAPVIDQPPAYKPEKPAYTGELSEYERGFIRALEEYSYLGNGDNRYVGGYAGAKTKTLDEAIDTFLLPRKAA